MNNTYTKPVCEALQEDICKDSQDNSLADSQEDIRENSQEDSCADSQEDSCADDFRLVPCEDGSLTIHSALHDQCFHSSAGALLESQYIYIELALHSYLKNHDKLSPPSARLAGNDADILHSEVVSPCSEVASPCSEPTKCKSATNTNRISILEIGFGSGINALLCALEFLKQQRKSEDNSTSTMIFEFESIELYPIPESIWSKLDYASLLSNETSGDYPFSTNEISAIFEKIHQAAWNERCEILPGFFLHKRHADILTFEPASRYQVVFFDAFSPDCQPDLWSKDVFAKIKERLLPGAVMTTYSSKGFVKQNLRELGFEVLRKPGPGHKRHVLQIHCP